MVLTSLKYSHLVSWLAYNRHGVILNKTQMQKILFICYGLCLAKFGETIFKDDAPKTWPFGPVFPIVYFKYKEDIPASLTKGEKDKFAENTDVLREIVSVVDQFYSFSARDLSMWSHLDGSPWAETVFSGNDGSLQWNKLIPESTIKDFFSDEVKWKRGLM